MAAQLVIVGRGLEEAYFFHQFNAFIFGKETDARRYPCGSRCISLYGDVPPNSLWLKDGHIISI